MVRKIKNKFSAMMPNGKEYYSCKIYHFISIKKNLEAR
jgi:hypothetical protein